MQKSRAMSFLRGKYVAFGDADFAVKKADELFRVNGIRSSLFYLGEYVDRRELVADNLRNKIAVIQALSKTHLDVHVSVDPTQVGHSIDPKLARDSTEKIAEEIRTASGNR